MDISDHDESGNAPSFVRLPQEKKGPFFYTAEAIPDLDSLFLPASMNIELRTEVGKTLKNLKREYQKEEIDKLKQRHTEYLKMEGWNTTQKDARRKVQNRAAAKRARIKKMEMIWALCQGIQDLYRANLQFQQQQNIMRQHSEACLGTIDKLQQETQTLKLENDQLREMRGEQPKYRAQMQAPMGLPKIEGNLQLRKDARAIMVSTQSENSEYKAGKLFTSLEQMLRQNKMSF